MGLADTVLTKPTGARDEEFHGAITEDLGDWAWTTTPTVEAVKVVGDGDSRRVGEIRDLLERLGVPTGVYPPDSPIGRAITDAAGPGVAYPVVEVMGQTVLTDPTDRQIATAFGAVVDVQDSTFDLAVVGAGPAGLGGSGVRGVGGAVDAGPRGRGVRRPGGHELDDPQLPRLPARHHR